MALSPMLQTFIYGDKGQKLTPEQVAERRARMAADQAKPIPGMGHWAASLNQGLTGFLGGRDRRNADQAESEGMARGQSVIDALVGRAGGGGGYGGGSMSSMGGEPSGTWTPAVTDPNSPRAIGNDAMAALGKQSNSPMTPQEMIIAGSEARDLDPLDVATAISYETGGTFDPMQRGPTTQWGQHQGLIQFGGPQREQYGVDMSSPESAMESQLNPETGAVWGYLDGTGVKPGMGLDNIYSAINAGAPGRFNASDANNGGAPGTVADKVAGMGDHRAKAAQFLGGTWTPSEGNNVTMSTQGQPAPQGGIAELLAAASDPWAMKQAGPVIQALLGQEMGRQSQANDPLRQLQIQQAQFDLQQSQMPQSAKPIEINGQLVDPSTGQVMGDYRTADLPDPGFMPVPPDEVTALGLPPGAYQRGPDNKISQIGNPGTTINNNMGGDAGQYLYGTDGGVPAGWRVDRALGVASPIPGGPVANENRANQTKAGNAKSQGQLKLGTTLESLNLNINEIDNGGMGVTGAMGDARRTWLGRALTGDDAMDFANRSSQITDSAALAEIQNMRDNSPTGGAVGSLTDGERVALGNARTAMNVATGGPEYARAAKAYRKLALDLAFGEGKWALNQDGTVSENLGDNSGGAIDFSAMAPADILAVDVMTLTPDQFDDYERALKNSRVQP